MKRSDARALAAALVAVMATAGMTACGGARGEATTPGPATAPAAAERQGAEAAIARARADSARRPWTEADVRFMQHMIHHHAQALEMSAMAPTHGARPQVRTLAERIANSQRDEIVTMQRWLRDREQEVPEVPGMHPDGAPDAHAVHGAHGAHDAGDPPMPGMLTEAEMRALDAARGRDFDRLFLTSMIRHHRGAVQMVEELFGTYGAGQDETVFRFATDVNVDQLTEIARMERMLLAIAIEDATP